MEFCEGIKITDVDRIKRENLDIDEVNAFCMIHWPIIIHIGWKSTNKHLLRTNMRPWIHTW
jgi:hypothetical protein